MVKTLKWKDQGLKWIKIGLQMDYLHGNEPVEDNELDIVIALFDDQVDVAAGSCLHSCRSS